MGEQIDEMSKTNVHSMISIALSIIGVIGFCVSMVPLAWVPGGEILFAISIIMVLSGGVTGLISLMAIKKNKQKGRTFALIGIGLSAIVLASLLLMLFIF